MIVWYEDDKLKIEFDREPKVGISYPYPFYSKCENKTLIEKCFTLKNDINVFITYKGKKYSFGIKNGYCWDGATIPRLFWRVIGSNTDPHFIIASMLHDVLCENHYFIQNNRYLSTLVLEKCLKVGGVGSFKRWLMKHSVDNFQKLYGKW